MFYFRNDLTINYNLNQRIVEENKDNERKEIFSERVRAGKRTYFFDVKATRSNDYYLIKSAPIQSGGTLQIIDGGAKYVIQSADVIKVVSNTASSCDVWVSAVDAISD